MKFFFFFLGIPNHFLRRSGLVRTVETSLAPWAGGLEYKERTMILTCESTRAASSAESQRNETLPMRSPKGFQKLGEMKGKGREGGKEKRKRKGKRKEKRKEQGCKKKNRRKAGDHKDQDSWQKIGPRELCDHP